jgi:acetate kinase
MSVEANSWGVRIDAADVIQGIEDCRELAPLHNARHSTLMLTKFLSITFAILNLRKIRAQFTWHQ